MKPDARRRMGLALLVMATVGACSDRASQEAPEGAESGAQAGGQIVDFKTLTVEDVLAGAECQEGDTTPAAILQPLPMPAHLSPAALPPALAAFSDLVYVDSSPEAARIARTLDIPADHVEVWSDALRERGMTIRIAVDLSADLAQLKEDREVLGLYAPGQAILVDADATLTQEETTAPGEDTLDADGVFWTPEDTASHELAHFDDDLRAKDSPGSIGGTAVSNANLWNDVAEALPDATVVAYEKYGSPEHRGEIMGDVPGEIWADAWTGYQAANTAGATGEERFEIIGESLAYGTLNEKEEQSAGATVDAFFRASEKCGPAGSLQYREDGSPRPDWAYEVGGGAVGKVAGPARPRGVSGSVPATSAGRR